MGMWRLWEKMKMMLLQHSKDIILISKTNNYYNCFVEAEKLRKDEKRVNIYLEYIQDEIFTHMQQTIIEVD